MLFKPEMIDAIVAGKKTQTRRIVRPGEYQRYLPSLTFANQAVIAQRGIAGHFTKWEVGRSYAVQPGRGKPGAWWKPKVSCLALPDTWLKNTAGLDYRPDNLGGSIKGWQPLRIRITAIRREHVGLVSRADAQAEGILCRHCKGYTANQTGCTCIELYSQLWDRINTRQGARWQDNPEVWVISFEVAR